MISRELYFSGINGSDGEYFADVMDISQAAAAAHGRLPGPEHRRELGAKSRQPAPFPLRPDLDPDDLAQAGWAVVFPSVEEASAGASRQREIREALAPLLEHRRAQATRIREHRYREYAGDEAYRSGESKQKYLGRLGAGPGPADPDKVPYYLLLVASPEEIPYRIQYQLDVQYAVGRIHFDRIEEYRHYAQSVIAAETSPRSSPRDMAFFAPCNPDDTVSDLITGYLARPLASHVKGLDTDWRVQEYIGDPATKNGLSGLLGGQKTPSLLFSSGHGVVFDADDARLLRHQGALVCQDWTGPRNNNFSRDVYFSAEDIAEDADLSGLIAFHYACYSAGFCHCASSDGESARTSTRCTTSTSRPGPIRRAPASAPGGPGPSMDAPAGPFGLRRARRSRGAPAAGPGGDAEQRAHRVAPRLPGRPGADHERAIHQRRTTRPPVQRLVPHIALREPG